MNSTSLYVTTNQIVLKADPANTSTWHDLYRLVPYLRNSLCCVVCGNLLVDPLTPTLGRCQHHLCRRCEGGRKKIKPACTWCRTCTDYTGNKSLRMLLQCYRFMCIYLTNSFIYKALNEQADKPDVTGVERGASSLILLIKEGAAFNDVYESSGGLPKSAYYILPCIYTKSSLQTQSAAAAGTNADGTPNIVLSTNIQNRPSLYSVVYPGAGNKLTIKRKTKDSPETQSPKLPMLKPSPKPIPKPAPKPTLKPTSRLLKKEAEKSIFKKPSAKPSLRPKRGCRCGNATATPGKLTCCGQRCPCYVESKPCVECKCRGCRNPHRPDGNKVRPHILEMRQVQVNNTELLSNFKLEDVEVDGSFPSFSHEVDPHFQTLEATNLLLNGQLLMNEDEEDSEVSVV